MGYEHVAHRDLERPEPTQGEGNGTDECEAVKVKTVEEPQKYVEEHENKLRDIELEIDAEDERVRKDVYSDKGRVRSSLPHTLPVPQLVPDMHSGQEKEHCTHKDKVRSWSTCF